MNLPTYDFKVGPESLWLIFGLAVGAIAAYVASTTSIPTEWGPWLVGLVGAVGAAVSRPIWAIILSLINPEQPS